MKPRLYITYKDGYAEVEIERSGVRKPYDAKYRNVENKDIHDFCVEVAEKVENEIGEDVEWSLVQQNKKKKSTAKTLIIVLVSILAIVGLIFVGMVTYAYMHPRNNENTTASQSVSTGSTTAREDSSGNSGKTSAEEQSYENENANPFEFGDGYDDSNSSYTRYIGTITNVSDETHYFVKVRGTFTDDDGNSIDTAWAYACGDEGLNPGESTKFTLSVPRDERITHITYNVFDYK